MTHSAIIGQTWLDYAVFEMKEVTNFPYLEPLVGTIEQ